MTITSPKREAANADTTVALAEAVPKTRFTAWAELERYSRNRKRIIIRHRSGDEVLAMIEIVSLGNKANRHATVRLLQL